MSDWNTDFHNISINYTNKMVKIKNNKELVKFLDDPKTQGSRLLAKHILTVYNEKMGKPLKIKEDSLAIEILGHVYLDHFAKLASKVPALKERMEEIESHTEIIDCGESDVDSNRHIWDDLEKNYCKLIFAMFREHA